MVVVTGAEDQLGQALVRALVEADCKVRAVVKDPHAPGLDGLPVEKVTGSVMEPRSLIAAFADADLVFHCDEYVDLMPYRFPRLYKYNVRGTEWVIHACRVNRVQRLVYLTSSLAFGHDPATGVVSEALGFRPYRALNPYGRTKAVASQKVQAANGTALETVIVGHAPVVGPYDYRFSPLGMVIWEYSRRRLPVACRGSLDMVDCRDVADVAIRAGRQALPGSVYLVSGGHMSVQRLLRNLQQITGIRIPLIHLPRWMMYVVAFLYEISCSVGSKKTVYVWSAIDFIAAGLRVSTTKLREELGFEPRPLRQSMADAWAWYKDHHHSL